MFGGCYCVHGMKWEDIAYIYDFSHVEEYIFQYLVIYNRVLYPFKKIGQRICPSVIRTPLLCTTFDYCRLSIFKQFVGLHFKTGRIIIHLKGTQMKRLLLQH
jgi:hypothetical protein